MRISSFGHVPPRKSGACWEALSSDDRFDSPQNAQVHLIETEFEKDRQQLETDSSLVMFDIDDQKST